MPVEMNETRLPGVGVKYTLPLAGGGRLVGDPPQRRQARALLVPAPATTSRAR